MTGGRPAGGAPVIEPLRSTRNTTLRGQFGSLPGAGGDTARQKDARGSAGFGDDGCTFIEATMPSPQTQYESVTSMFFQREPGPLSLVRNTCPGPSFTV